MLCSLNEAADYLRSHDDYRILTHRRPDGDTVGSAVALCHILRALGKTAWIYPNPDFTPKYEPFLDTLVGASSARPQNTPTFTQGGRALLAPTVVSVDVATRGLFPFGAEDAEVALALDHHGTNEGFAALTHVDPDAAACGEIVWALTAELAVAPTRAIAEAVYLAVSTDTGCFRYANVRPNTLRTAAACIEAGAEVYPINRSFFECKRWPRLELEALLINSMAFYRNGLVAVGAIYDADMQRLGLTEDDVDDISGFCRNVEGVEIGVMLREVEGGKGKVSVRSSPRYDAAAICARLGGGGHPGAAGATVDGGIEAAKAAILEAIEAELRMEN